MKDITLPQFEGPLDLLLSLIEEKHLDITNIALSEVTGQFLVYIKQLETIENPGLVADYLKIAARLLVIKSKTLLPTIEVEIEEEKEVGPDLTDRLIVYKQYKLQSQKLREMSQTGNMSYFRTAVYEQKVSFFPDPNFDRDKLSLCAQKVARTLKELEKLPEAKIKEVISIQEKITQLQARLSQTIETKLSDLFNSARSKSDMIITFLALLELVKQRIFTVEQEELFADTVVKRYNKPTN